MEWKNSKNCVYVPQLICGSYERNFVWRNPLERNRWYRYLRLWQKICPRSHRVLPRADRTGGLLYGCLLYLYLWLAVASMLCKVCGAWELVLTYIKIRRHDEKLCGRPYHIHSAWHEKCDAICVKLSLIMSLLSSLQECDAYN